MLMPAHATVPAAPSGSDGHDPHQVWQRVLSFLQPKTGEAQFETYLRGTRGLAYDPGASVIRVAAANPFHVPWLEGKLSSAIHTVVADVIGGPVRVEFVTDADVPSAGSQRRRQRPAPLLTPLEAAIAPVDTPSDRPRADNTPALPGQRRGWAQGSPFSSFNPRYTFASFVVGPSNRLAHAASLAIVDQPG